METQGHQPHQPTHPPSGHGMPHGPAGHGPAGPSGHGPTHKPVHHKPHHQRPMQHQKPVHHKKKHHSAPRTPPTSVEMVALMFLYVAPAAC